SSSHGNGERIDARARRPGGLALPTPCARRRLPPAEDLRHHLPKRSSLVADEAPRRRKQMRPASPAVDDAPRRRPLYRSPAPEGKYAQCPPFLCMWI
ncbi:unnamed protein product, partial [Urochloa humidicola]